MTNESVPEAPTILTTGATEEEIFVSWSMDPSKITCELCNYQVCYYAEGKQCEENQNIKYPVLNYTIKGLQPNTKYKLKVRAKGCRTGYGPWSYEVTKQTLGQLLQGDMLIIISAGGVIFVLLIVAVILVVFICKRRRNSDRDASKDALNELALLPREGHKNYIDPCAYDDPEEALKSFAKEIPMTSIKMDKLIGGGEFGEVYKGDLQLPDATPSYPVAIKVLKPNAKKKDRDDFLSEASIMGQFKDPNVVNLEGVVTKGSRIMIVTEFMSNGSLDNFLKQNDGQLSVLQLLGMARGISSGMKYLSEISFIHRDLAARNILVNENLACKVADFGLSRELEDSEEGLESEYETRGGKIPVRWTAPEAIQFRKFSTASDVWSYGILLWETLSFGQRPYWDWGNFEVIERVETGYRLPPPMGCPKVVHQIMLDCWENDRVARPKFVDIVRRLDELIRSPDLLDDKSSRLSQVIKPIEVDVSTTSIQDWLDELKMGQYIENFTNAGYTSLNQVALMRENDLNNIGIRLVGHRHKLNTSISAMQKKAKRQASLLI